MRLVFAGTPEPAVPSLEVLARQREVLAVVTRPPAPVGRRRVLTPSPVAVRARDLGLPLLETRRLDADATERITTLQPDLGVVVAYGALLREPLLSAPRLGWVNLHFSLLPRWRGAAPVQHAVMAGDTETGVSVFRLEAGLDTGPVYRREPVAIGALETAGHLLGRLADVGAGVLAAVVRDLDAGTAAAEPQVGEPTLAPKLDVRDGHLDWHRAATAVFARIRGATPEPGASTELGGARLKILAAAPARDAAALPPGVVEARAGRVLVGTATEPLELVTVQPAGRTAMPAAAWLRGLPEPPRFG